MNYSTKDLINKNIALMSPCDEDESGDDRGYYSHLCECIVEPSFLRFISNNKEIIVNKADVDKILAPTDDVKDRLSDVDLVVVLKTPLKLDLSITHHLYFNGLELDSDLSDRYFSKLERQFRLAKRIGRKRMFRSLIPNKVRINAALFIGLACMFAGFNTLRAYRWLSVEGVIHSISIESHTSRPGGGIRKPNFDFFEHKPIINYHYVLNGKEYNSNNRRLGIERFSNTWAAGRIMRRYSVGNRVIVRVHPRKHNISVIEPQMQWGDYFLVFFGLFLIWLSSADVAPARSLW